MLTYAYKQLIIPTPFQLHGFLVPILHATVPRFGLRVEDLVSSPSGETNTRASVCVHT